MRLHNSKRRGLDECCLKSASAKQGEHALLGESWITFCSNTLPYNEHLLVLSIVILHQDLFLCASLCMMWAVFNNNLTNSEYVARCDWLKNGPQGWGPQGWRTLRHLKPTTPQSAIAPFSTCWYLCLEQQTGRNLLDGNWASMNHCGRQHTALYI